MCGDSTLHCPWWQWLGDFEGQRLSYADMDGAGRGPGNLPMPQVGKRGPSQADAGGTACGRTHSGQMSGLPSWSLHGRAFGSVLRGPGFGEA